LLFLFINFYLENITMADTTGQLPYQQIIRIPVDAAAAGSDLLTPLCVAPFAGTVASVSYIPRTTLTGANTDTRTITVINETQSLTSATKAFTSGVNAAANTATAITLSGTAANLVVASGDVVSWNSAHSGSTGLADPGGLVELTLTRTP